MVIIRPLVGIPIKPFGVAKARLAPALGPEARRLLGQAIATRTLEVARASGADVAVVTADRGVAGWAHAGGWRVVEEPPTPGGLDAAAEALVRAASDRPWGFLHADLPLVEVEELARAWSHLGTGGVIAPSHDGGTSLFAGRGRVHFSYGVGSFFRHLAAMPDATVLSTPGLALDLDTATDLRVLRLLPSGEWIERTLAPLATMEGTCR